jgi:hypothetical protein
VAQSSSRQLFEIYRKIIDINILIQQLTFETVILSLIQIVHQIYVEGAALNHQKRQKNKFHCFNQGSKSVERLSGTLQLRSAPPIF